MLNISTKVPMFTKSTIRMQIESTRRELITHKVSAFFRTLSKWQENAIEKNEPNSLVVSVQE